MTWAENDWNRLATLFDGVPGTAPYGQCPDWPIVKPYAGYRPAVVEAPNGDTKACARCAGTGDVAIGLGENGMSIGTCYDCDGIGRVPNTDAAGVCGCCGGKGHVPWSPGTKRDQLNMCVPCSGTGRTPGKRYLHVAPKYNPPAWALEYYARAHYEACRVATALGVPAAYRPHEAFGALRVLDYPPDAGTVEHCDFDLFTIVLWRSTPEDLELIPYADPPHSDPEGIGERVGSLGLHIGEIGELVGLGPATPHRVPARPYSQKSIIYFAIPDHAARLPCCGCEATMGHRDHGCGCEATMGHRDHGYGCRFERPLTVGQWLDERMKRSRVYK